MWPSLSSAQKNSDMIDFLALQAVAISDSQVLQFVFDHYGFRPSIKVLSSERDQNFHVCSSDGEEFVLKITHPGEARQITNFHTEALLHIAEKNAALPVPMLYPSLAGEHEVILHADDQSEYVVRLLSYLPGVPLAHVEPCLNLRFNLGACLAEVGKALQDFTHPIAQSYELLWDAKHAARLKELIVHINEPEKKEVLKQVLQNFEKQVAPQLIHLRWQVIHNDLNPHNVLVSPTQTDQITGIFDFGDMVYTPLIIDVAVGAAYNIDEDDFSLDAVAAFIQGYHSKNPLQPQEIAVLYDLIAVRLAMVILISNWRAALYPENSKYLLRNHDLSWKRLVRLLSIPKEEATTYFKQGCSHSAVFS